MKILRAKKFDRIQNGIVMGEIDKKRERESKEISDEVVIYAVP